MSETILGRSFRISQRSLLLSRDYLLSQDFSRLFQKFLFFSTTFFFSRESIKTAVESALQFNSPNQARNPTEEQPKSTHKNVFFSRRISTKNTNKRLEIFHRSSKSEKIIFIFLSHLKVKLLIYIFNFVIIKLRNTRPDSIRSEDFVYYNK